ncbi:PBP1A family penicillin-binding protein [Rubrobacter taiwanensis]|jgi:1A family penicillin-binding protein|uniref:PBP1A family penicillin-binding protein n=1 Tax=Rubrobacter taiwanensis TaxID=185139 RepID=A0A4V2NWB6_9ACTN|nr:PBP1A family penicillin-binding protein [Rubrobacter taiwanensis]TCJ16732.1 PBP1A family penicillin-binding protein [Rubrobacter taiwanensis]
MARAYPRRSGARGRSATGAATLGKRPRKRRPARAGKGGGSGRLLSWLVAASILACVAGVSALAGGYLGLVRVVNELPEPLSTTARPTYIYSAPLGDTDGSRRVIGTIFQGENRQTAKLEEMPGYLLDALVAKEDERFREHAGIDLWGIMRALYVDLRAGQAVQGASTITQQFVKNAYLSGEVSITRKLKEAAIAIEIERRYTKDEIIGMYLNTVYFGNNAYGVEAAAQTYFNKPTEELTLSESATLVGLLWSPSTLGSDRDAAREQRNLVLRNMFNNGYITQQDYDRALSEELPEKWPLAPMLETGLTGPEVTRDFVEYVRGELTQMYGANTVQAGGLTVYTSLDPEAQLAAEETLYGDTGYLPYESSPDGAIVSIEPETGYIRAMVGARDQDGDFNLVTQGRRQPGSTFKTFALIAALEQGISPQEIYVSEDKEYVVPMENGREEKWEVENYRGAERGPITLEEALWESDNTVFTDLITNAEGNGLRNGPQATIDVAHRLGITSEFEPLPSIVLGTQEVSPLEMATAYATIANYGERVTPRAITRVIENHGTEDEKVLYEAPPMEGEQVLDPEVARETIRILEDGVTEGIARKAALGGDRPVAGKSGTTESFFDAWFVGFTPQLVTSVWLGYAEGGKTLEEAAYGSPIVGTSYPLEIWRDYMSEVMQGEPVERFDHEPAPTSVASSGGQ